MLGSLFIVTAASGTGKTSLVKQLIATTNDVAVSISHTTRSPRSGEMDGQDYHFTSQASFIKGIESGEFMEHAQVFDNFYGTSQRSVTKQLNSGTDVILEIDWQGALQVKKIYPSATMIFILPPNRATLRQRLSSRGQDSEAVIEARLAGAAFEMKQYVHFEYLVINDHFEAALAELKAIIVAKRQTIDRQQIRYGDIIAELLKP